jgi:small-conductance mechanosensitive channel
MDVFTDISRFVQDWLWVVAGIILFIAVMVYALAYMARYFEYLKMQESRYLDVATLDFIHRVLEWVWIGIVVIVILGFASARSPDVAVLLREFILRFPAILFAILTIFVGAVLIRALRRFGAFLSGDLRVKPKRIAPPRLWGAMELFLKYLIAGIFLLLAFVGAVNIWPRGTYEYPALVQLQVSLTSPAGELFKAILIGILGVIVAFILARFSDSVFEDLKQRSKKHGPRVLDQFKGIARSCVYLVSAVTIVFVELGLFTNAEVLAVFTALFILGAAVVLVVAFDSLRNAFAGVALTQADPFSVGDRVKIGDDLVGDVTAISLTMTQIRTGRGELVTLPNRGILALPVLNFTRSEHNPIFVDVVVGWEVPHQTVEQLLLDAARRTPGILETPPPQVYGKDVAGNAIVHQLLAYTNDPEQMKQVKSALVYTIQDLFHERKLKALASAA